MVLFLVVGIEELIWGIPVDGAAWRTYSANPGAGFPYPDFLLKDEVITGVKGGKKAKL